MEHSQQAGDGAWNHRLYLHHVGQPPGHGGDLCQPRFHFPIYYLMANLAAADFFAGVGLLLPNVQHRTQYSETDCQHVAPASGPHWHQPGRPLWPTSWPLQLERHITVFRMQLRGWAIGAWWWWLWSSGPWPSSWGYPQCGLELHLWCENCSSMVAPLQRLLLGLLGHFQPGDLCRHGGSVCSLSLAMFAEDYEDVSATVLDPDGIGIPWWVFWRLWSLSLVSYHKQTRSVYGRDKNNSVNLHECEHSMQELQGDKASL